MDRRLRLALVVLGTLFAAIGFRACVTTQAIIPYDSYAQAERAETHGIRQGWIPAFLPRSADSILSRQSEVPDGKGTRCSFRFRKGDIAEIERACEPLRIAADGTRVFYCPKGEGNRFAWCAKIDGERGRGDFEVVTEKFRCF